jgi:OmpA-OmpF porin, OOP family
MYGLRSEAEGKISESQSLDLRDVPANEVMSKDFNLAPIEVASIAPNVKIVLNNIFFDFDKSTLKAESGPELDRLVDLLKENRSMQIEISGHTDNMGPDAYNMSLSERRAKTVVAYLIRRGIAKDRLSTQFFGETKPAGTNETEEGRSKNRRVEFLILKI